MENDRREQLNFIFKDVDENEKKLIDPLLDELVDMETQLEELRKLPMIRINPKNPAIQKKTEAAKLRKEISQSYMNAIRILCSILNKIESSAQDELLARLEEFA